VAPKVLLIDDFYGDFEDGLKARFGPDNVSCLRYPNAREALRMVRAEGINAVLLDVQFVRDEHDNEVKAANVGPDVLRAIKRARPDLPVHILTSFARTLRPDEILELEPADGRTQKPHPEASEQTYIDFYDTLFREVSFSVRLAGVTDWDAEMGFVVGKSQTMVAVALGASWGTVLPGYRGVRDGQGTSRQGPPSAFRLF
jgi:CheY-like chemotaxis protein